MKTCSPLKRVNWFKIWFPMIFLWWRFLVIFYSHTHLTNWSENGANPDTKGRSLRKKNLNKLCLKCDNIVWCEWPSLQIGWNKKVFSGKIRPSVKKIRPSVKNVSNIFFGTKIILFVVPETINFPKSKPMTWVNNSLLFREVKKFGQIMLSVDNLCLLPTGWFFGWISLFLK